MNKTISTLQCKLNEMSSKEQICISKVIQRFVVCCFTAIPIEKSNLDANKNSTYFFGEKKERKTKRQKERKTLRLVLLTQACASSAYTKFPHLFN
jgi:hypothetical protein